MDDNIEVVVPKQRKGILDRLGLLPPKLPLPCLNCGAMEVRQDRYSHESHTRADGSQQWAVECWHCHAKWRMVSRYAGTDAHGQDKWTFTIKMPSD